MVKNLLRKLGIGRKLVIGGFLAGLTVAIAGCPCRGYFGANDPALKYNPDAQKEKAERIAESLDGRVSIYTLEF